VRARVMDSSPLKQGLYELGMKAGLSALARGKHSRSRPLLFARAEPVALGLRSPPTGVRRSSDTFKFFQAWACVAHAVRPDESSAPTPASGGPGRPERRAWRWPTISKSRIDIRNPWVAKSWCATQHVLGIQERGSLRRRHQGRWLQSACRYFNDNKQSCDRRIRIWRNLRGERFSPQYIENKLKFSPISRDGGVGRRRHIGGDDLHPLSIISKWARKTGFVHTYTIWLAAEVYALLRRR